MRTEYQVSWVYCDADESPNHAFGDLSRSFMSYPVLLTEEEAQQIKEQLKVFYDLGDIMDVYVGPVNRRPMDFAQITGEIKDCLGDLGEIMDVPE